MRVKISRPKSNIEESFTLYGDKSIAHRALILGALPKGKYKIINFPLNRDCMTTLKCMNKLGVIIRQENSTLYVSSPGYEGFNKNVGTLDCENSGTTVRLLSGVLSGIGAECTLIGDSSLSKRPMSRIEIPLLKMGANIESNNGYIPINFKECAVLEGITYELPVASAQVKSCILIAGFLSDNNTTVIEKVSTRDHTERIFKYLGADIFVNSNSNSISISRSKIMSKDFYIPGDISSAAFIIACALLGENCKVTLKNVLLNDGRIKYITLLKKMGALISIKENGIVNGENIGDISVVSSKMYGIEIEEDIIPSIIDEIPVLAVISAFSNGTTSIHGIEELKYKESNRVESIIKNLRNIGIECNIVNDTIIIHGNDSIIDKTISFESFNDHRIAMAFMAVAMRNKGCIIINNWECTDVSFPNAICYFNKFFDIRNVY
ncbi:3-phosphoshikimate 1-carboxyvinyltransferase [Clostridium tepidiprofundi]|uniref:3-phosphoshikimate 1-carboxyvinyltransferase n=1 Tax=Clostridium tepidiprofundi TaxID=420412 RepID=UPI00082B4BCF|nr:3-phosphoshikimate 1-carboxyvinyltransferase [Clostridium tepidiprofundi]